MTAEVPANLLNLQAETEAQYDATVRADIELFRSYAEKFMAGSLTDDEFRAQRLRRGVYSQRQAGVHMIRTKIPGGSMTAAQMDQLALDRRRIRRRQGPPDHAPEHSVSFCSAAAGVGSAAQAGRFPADHARSLLQHGPQRDRLPAQRPAGRRSFRRASLRAEGGVRVPAQGTHRQHAAQVQDRVFGLPGRLHAAARSTTSDCAR